MFWTFEALNLPNLSQICDILRSFGFEKAISEKFTFEIQFFGTNLHFDLLDHQVDILRVVLSHKCWMIHHITWGLIVILAKHFKILRKLSRSRHQGVPRGRGVGSYQFFWELWLNCPRYIYFDKTLVIRSISNQKKLKFTKIGPKSPKYPRRLFGGRPKKFQLINMNMDKSFALTSKIKNFKNYRILLALKFRNPHGRENQVGARFMGMGCNALSVRGVPDRRFKVRRRIGSLSDFFWSLHDRTGQTF